MSIDFYPPLESGEEEFLGTLSGGSGSSGNILIDGECQVAQGGVVNISTVPQFGPIDMWSAWISAGAVSAGTIAQGGSGGLPSQTTLQALGLTLTGTGTVSFRQRIEKNVARALAITLGQLQGVFGPSATGMPISASFMARTSNISGTPASCVVVLRIPTVADNFAATTVLATSAPVGLPQDNTIHKLDFNNIVTITGDTIQTGLEIEFQVTIGAVTNKFVLMTQAQLCLGSQAPPVFVTTPFDIQYLRVLRYFQKSFQYSVAPAQATADLNGVLNYQAWRAGAASTQIPLVMKVPMRITNPAFTFYNPVSANALWRNRTLNADSGAAAVLTTGEYYNTITNAQAALDAAGHTMSIHWTADARL